MRSTRGQERLFIRGLTEQIHCPVLVCDAGDDRFFAGQPEQLAEALGGTRDPSKAQFSGRSRGALPSRCKPCFESSRDGLLEESAESRHVS
jgi:hypothetical protein